MDPFLQKKWERVFSTFFDTNRDGVLEWPDFVGIIDRIREVRGADCPIFKTAEKTFEKIWENLVVLADKNKDDKISLDEWKQMWKVLTSSSTGSNWQSDYLNYMFTVLDSSGDNLIDREEYIAVMESYGVPKAEANSAFDKFAVGADGKPLQGIDLATFKALWKEFFEATEPSAKGNFLFGMV
jgi:Ca2+-binding EF-hand superfamily protein